MQQLDQVACQGGPVGEEVHVYTSEALDFDTSPLKVIKEDILLLECVISISAFD